MRDEGEVGNGGSGEWGVGNGGVESEEGWGIWKVFLMWFWNGFVGDWMGKEKVESGFLRVL